MPQLQEFQLQFQLREFQLQLRQVSWISTPTLEASTPIPTLELELELNPTPTPELTPTLTWIGPKFRFSSILQKVSTGFTGKFFKLIGTTF